jgi:uncharacterized protein (DUF1778 family)
MSRLAQQRAPSVPKATRSHSAKARSGRSAVINLRASEHTKQVLEQAATALGKTLSEFMIESARRSAEDILIDQRLFTLDTQQFDAFIRILDNPPAPSEKLRALMKRKPLWQK